VCLWQPWLLVYVRRFTLLIYLFNKGIAMIYLQISELIEAKKAQWGRHVTLTEVSEYTGISRMTLFRMMKNRGYNTVTDHLDRLCEFFQCEIHELVRFVPTPQHSFYSCNNV
jgi:putative transcriptional regulator